MELLKELSPTALMCLALIYVVRYMGNHMSTMSKRIEALADTIREMLVVLGRINGRSG